MMKDRESHYDPTGILCRLRCVLNLDSALRAKHEEWAPQPLTP